MLKKYLLLGCAIGALTACGGGEKLDYGPENTSQPTPTPEPPEVEYDWSFTDVSELDDWTIEFEKLGPDPAELYHQDTRFALGIKPWWGEEPNSRDNPAWTGNNWDYVEVTGTYPEPIDARAGTLYISVYYPVKHLGNPWGTTPWGESAHHIGTQFVLVDTEGRKAHINTGSSTWNNSFSLLESNLLRSDARSTAIGPTTQGAWVDLAIPIGLDEEPVGDDDAGFDITNVVGVGVRFNFAFEKPENLTHEQYADGIPEQYLFVDDVALKPYEGDTLPTPVPEPEAPAANVIANSGLEGDAVGGGASGWNGYGGDSAWAVSDTEAYLGSKSYSATLTTVGGDPWGIEGGPANIPVIPGNTYVYSAWVKGPAGATTKATVSLGESPWSEFGNSGDVTLTGGWDNITFEVEITGDVREVRAPFHVNYDTNAGAVIYFDEVRLIGPPAGNFVVNGDLESDAAGAMSASGWAAYGGDATFMVIDTDAHSGSKSFQATLTTVGGDPWGIEGGPNPISVTGGQTYLYSAWVKGTPGATTKATVSMTASPWSEFGNSGDITLTDSWQRVTFNVEIPEDVDVVRAPFHFNYGTNAGAVIMIDDVELIGLDAPVNAVPNSGLEDDAAGTTAVTGWNGYGGDATFMVSDAEAHSGNNSYLATLTTAGGDPWGIEGGPASVNVIPDKTYKYSAWVMGPAGATVQGTVSLPMDPWTGYAYSGNFVLDGTWQEITMDVTPGAGTVRMPIQFNFDTNAASLIYVDDVALTGPAAPQSLILNGDVEDGTTSGWNGYGGSSTFEATTNDKHGGGYAYAANVAGVSANAWDIEAGPASIPVLSGQTYNYSAWVKGPAGASVQASVSLPMSPWTGFAYSGEFALNGEWQEITMDVEIPADVNIVRAPIQLSYAGNEGVTILIDDVTLKPIP